MKPMSEQARDNMGLKKQKAIAEGGIGVRFEYDYLRMLLDLRRCPAEENRTGVAAHTKWGHTLEFDCCGRDLVPLLTTKKMFWKGIVEELLMFLRGDTQTKEHLESKGVNIWKGNTSRAYLDSFPEGDPRRLYEEGEMGLMYGSQWRDFGGSIDQLSRSITMLKEKPQSRDNVVTAWNPMDLDSGVLSPCHILWNVGVVNGKLNMAWFQRSVDTFLGLPFNIASYGLLLLILSKVSGIPPGKVTFFGSNVHLYENAIDAVLVQLERKPLGSPSVKFHRRLETIADIEALTFEDIELVGYRHHPKLPKVEMAGGI